MEKRLVLIGLILACAIGACRLPDIITPTPPPVTDTPTGAEVEVCPGGADSVALLVDPRLAAGIRPSLDVFEADLCAEGHAIIERRLDFATAPEVRAYLADLYFDRTGRSLAGAIFIGEVPRAYQDVTLHSANPSIPDHSEEVISFQYYSDLDGRFEASAGYVSPGGHPYSYDVHAGNVDWEIWTGVLPIYKGDVSMTVAALKRYFAKDHAYRADSSGSTDGFLEVSEFFSPTTPAEDEQVRRGLVNGDYAWTPFSSAPDAYIYFNNSTGDLTVDQGYDILTRGSADFTVLDAHGFYGASGALDIAWVESHSVATTFLWSNGCATGNLDVADNWLTAVLYSPTSSVLVAKGTTNDSGGMGTNTNGFFGHNIATTLSAGRSFGQALLEHVNVPLLPAWAVNREFHFASPVTLGDPLLKLHR
jgi:hypothetical protein